MPRRRFPDGDDPRQSRFAWAGRDTILGGAPAGEVLFEAPELKPRPRRQVPPPRSIGLPFGVRRSDGDDGTPSCWSCGKPVGPDDTVRVGPGDSRCPGCGAKLPFIE